MQDELPLYMCDNEQSIGTNTTIQVEGRSMSLFGVSKSKFWGLITSKGWWHSNLCKCEAFVHARLTTVIVIFYLTVAAWVHNWGKGGMTSNPHCLMMGPTQTTWDQLVQISNEWLGNACVNLQAIKKINCWGSTYIYCFAFFLFLFYSIVFFKRMKSNFILRGVIYKCVIKYYHGPMRHALQNNGGNTNRKNIIT